MSSTLHLTAIGQKHQTALHQAGYQSVFDICTRSRDAFVRSLSDVPVRDARGIYREARQRAGQLKSLYRAWQLRQEPVMSRLKKLSAAPSTALHDALVRNIGGDGDLSDLMTRSSDYADAASIQSLFSPGRYAASLYAVAKQLHDDADALAIDTRRPDLKDLLLSETTMNQEVTSLDILLDVLQAEPQNTLDSLSGAYFPMTLPYDDKLTQISAALTAQDRTLNGVWDTLTDAQASAFAGDGQSARRQTKRGSAGAIDGADFYLKANDQMIYLADPVAVAAQTILAHMTLGKPSANNVTVAHLKLTRLDGALYLGVADDVVIGDTSLRGCYLTGNSGESTDTDGKYVGMLNPNGGGLQARKHLAVTRSVNTDGSVYLQTTKGYIGYASGDAGHGNNWENALTLDAAKGDALPFTFWEDDAGTVATPGVLPPDTTPNPPARTTLNLTPLSYQLMAATDLTEDDIRNHYGLPDATTRDGTKLADTLNELLTFCEKTGLTFNELLDLTAQVSWADSAGSLENKGRWQKMGATDTTNKEYGAAFLNSSSPDGNNSLWVYPDSSTAEPRLNFANQDVVGLAGNAEKLIRLRNTTGMTFEMLDWLIVQASQAAGYGAYTLDSVTLNALATCVDLTQRYGISENAFASLTGAVNPYAADQEKSFYETLFTSQDGTFTQPLDSEAIILSESDSDADAHAAYLQQRAVFCQAAGVTDDELTRILGYCGLKPGDTFSELVAGQIYRFGAIPRMLGMTFAQAELLWQLMAGGNDTLLTQLGVARNLSAIDLIHRTEQVLDWMSDNDLTLIQVQAMVSNAYSGTATAEMFTFLQNVYNGVKSLSDDARDGGLLRALAGGFSLKNNVMKAASDWLAACHPASNKIGPKAASSSYTLDDYWARISSVFKVADPTIDSLQDETDLVKWTQQLSQLVLVTRWLNLSEQDLALLSSPDTLKQLDGTLSAVKQPDLALLLLLTRFKRWQSQVTTTVDEALRLLPVLADATSEPDDVAGKIAALHNVNQDTVSAMNTLLFGGGDRPYPASFAQLYTLLTWLRTGQALNAGTASLHDLLTMAQSDAGAEDPALIARVADALAAGLSQTSIQ
ncbi:TPA: Tc toxin subunit A [Salmonella enterica]